MMVTADRDAKNASVSTLVVESSQFVLVKNRGGWKEISPGKGFNKPSKWGLPTGRREPQDKTLFDTAKRETEEETGGLWVDIDPDPRLRVERLALARNHLRIAFIAYPAAGKMGVPRDDNVIEARWFPLRSLWVEDPKDKDFVDIYPKHREMAQKLLRLRRNLQKQN